MKKKIIFWTAVAAIAAALICFLKFNPLYATVEVVAAFCIGLAAEWIAGKVYDKWIKTAVSDAISAAVTQTEQQSAEGAETTEAEVEKAQEAITEQQEQTSTDEVKS